MSVGTVAGVALGLLTMFLVFSIATSAVNEAMAGLFKRRANMLEKAIVGMFSRGLGAKGQNLSETLRGGRAEDSAEALKDAVYEHPLIRPYWRHVVQDRKPAYIPSSSFVPALLESLPSRSGAAFSLQNVGASIDDVPESDIKDALQSLWRDTEEDPERFPARVERWYDDTMNRVSGWYTRRTQLWLWVIGGVLVIGVNGDTMMVGRALWQEPALRDAVEAEARDIAENADTVGAATDAIRADEDLALPLGWSTADDGGFRDLPDDPVGWALKVVGLFVTVAAISMGSAFWFDVVKRLANIRSSGAPPPTAASTAPVTPSR